MIKKDKKESLDELLAKIPRLTNDDDMLTKFALNYINEIQKAIENPQAHHLDFRDKEAVLQACWPYYSQNSSNYKEVNNSPSKDEIASRDGNIDQDMENLSPPCRKEGKKYSHAINEYLVRIQQQVGRKIKLSDLCVIVKFLSEKAHIPLHKRDKLSKDRIYQWITTYDVMLSPYFNEAIGYLKETV